MKGYNVFLAIKLVVSIALLSRWEVHGLASYLVQEYFCDRELSVGTYIMNYKALPDEANKVTVWRGSTELTNGSSYVFGEQLTIRFSNAEVMNKGAQCIFEATGGTAVFSGPKSGCNDAARSRSYEDTPTLTMPTDSSSSAGVVKVLAGWSKGYSQVYITDAFVLNPPSSMESTEL